MLRISLWVILKNSRGFQVAGLLIYDDVAGIEWCLCCSTSQIYEPMQ